MHRRRGQYTRRKRDKKLQFLLAAIACVLAPGSADAAPAIESVHIVSRVGDDDVADPSPKRARREQGVTLFAVIQTRDGGRLQTFSDAKKVRLGGKVIVTAPMADAPAHESTWWRVEPTRDNLSNTASGSFRFETIPYRETRIDPAVGRESLRADVRPTLTPDRGHGLGTMRYQLRVSTPAGKIWATAGSDARAGRGTGGLDDHVHRVSLRADDSYIGFLGEMFGQPYIWASAGTTDRRHQSERLEGSDCADFVTYGWRRLGHSIPYTWTEGLRRFTVRLGKGTPDADGVYRDARGRPLRYPGDGDLVLFPRHVGVLVGDRGEIGVLDGADLMFHTLFKSPEIEEIAATGYGAGPTEILRWSRR